MSGSPGRQFGGAVDAALAGVVQTGATTISVADAGTREAFLDAWAQILSNHAKYLRSNSAPLSAPIVLVFTSDTTAFRIEHKWEQRSMLGASCRDDLAGILAVGTGEMGGCVHPRRLKDTEEFEREIRAGGLQSCPTIGLMTESKLVVWPDGIDSKPSPFAGDIHNGAVLINHHTIDEHLKHFYEEVARQTTRWWKNADLRITVSLPEKTVQYELWIYFLGHFGRAARIKSEEQIGNGRSDITVVPIDPGSANQSAVLELKTVRDVYTPKTNGKTPTRISAAENISWASSGVPQTAAYRDDNKMDVAFLCIYDFCKGNSNVIDVAVKPRADQHEVEYRRYWITASHDEHRNDRYPATVGTT